MDVSYEAQSLHESQLTIFLTIWASQTTYLTSWCGLFSCFTYYYWAYSPTFSFFKIQAHNPYFLSIPIHEMASINYSPYLHKVGFGEMFKANLFSKYHELLGIESVMPINFFFFFFFLILVFNLLLFKTLKSSIFHRNLVFFFFLRD